jgi:diguanylate cyclase (GGDEF)-like protein
MDVLTHSSEEPFQIEWVRNCSDALNRLDGIEAILVDLYLPDSHGIDSFDRLFHAAPRIPILVLIDAVNENTAKLAVQCGAQDYLLKDHLDAYLLPKTVTSMIERAACREALIDEQERSDITLESIGDALASTDVHDGLTDLPNRALLKDRLEEAITLSQRYRRELAVLHVNLDRFRHINDSLGLVVGDGLLQSVARRLFTCVRSSDTVGRQGGDEFMVLLWDIRRPEDAAVTATKILEALREPHHVARHVIHIGASIGIATYPDDGADADTLTQRADLAMRHAKDTGRDSFQFFKPEMSARAIERQSLEHGLHYALERHELVLHYQPKICLATGDIIGVEALIRWNHPQRGPIAPGQFIAIAEDCGLIVPIGRWVLREACRQARAWKQMDLAPLRIAVNVSPVELRAPGFVANLKAMLLDAAMESSILELEITEAALIEDARLPQDVPSVRDILRELKELGVLLALADFGTGHSSLSQLKYFPIDTLKIDRSFVRELARSEDAISIVAAVISLGKCLDIQVVAEEVETREQMETLKAHGCPQAQGYYFSVAVPPEELARLLERDASGIHFAKKNRSAQSPQSAGYAAI